MEYKKQHFIPKSYLEAWCDKDTPENHNPYVWIISKDRNTVNNRAPKKIFNENNFYTIYENDGKRNLSIEFSLSTIESKFAKLRKTKIDKRKPLTFTDELHLMMFASAMFGRTKARGEYEKQNWQEVLDFGNRIKVVLENAPPQEREKMAAALSPLNENKEGFTLDDIKHIVSNPMTTTLPNVVKSMTSLLLQTPHLILTTDDEIGFITSDNPCTWFDPANLQIPRPFGAGGLVSPTLEITLPLSPQNLLYISPGLQFSDLYLEVQDNFMLDNLNQRTLAFSDESVVVNKKIIKGEWFQN